MTDKEQIMIDGVDVSECVSFDKLNGQNICCYEDTREDKIPFANFCVENKDCYFKQLARKTQECEELKKDLQDYESWFDEYKILFTYDGRTPVTNDELYTCLEELVKKGNDETNRYRKVFEEIEEVINNILNSCLGRNTVGCRPAHNVCGDLIKILDIINKVKDGKNDNN